MGRGVFTSGFLLVFLFAIFAEGKTLPSWITPCRRSDPKLNACITAQWERVRPRLLTGIPEFLLPPYDPMRIPSLFIDQGTGSVRFRADFKNVVTRGARHVQVKKINLDLKNLQLDFYLLFPKLRITTDYEITGKVLVLPVQGKGSSDGNFTDVHAHVTLKGKYKEKHGEKYVDLVGKRVALQINGAQMYFDNFFNGNRQLIETTNRFLNDNWKDIVEEMKPVLEETLATLVFQLVKNVFEQYSLDEILPP